MEANIQSEEPSLVKNTVQGNLEKSASILCVGSGWFPNNPGGLERYVYDLTHTLAAGHDRVELCGIDLPTFESDYPIKLTNLASANDGIIQRFWSCRHNFRQTRGETPDAINLHFALYSFPIMDILPKEVPITFNFHGPWVSESEQEVSHQKISNFFKQWLIEKRTYQKCDRFIVLSQAFAQVLHQQYQIPAEKIYVIPGGVDTERFAPKLSPQAARIKLNFPVDRPILFASRRLVNRVGIDKLLSAIALIKPRIPDVWLAIGGCGPMEAALKQQAQELGLENNVKFIGFLPDADLPIAYQAADFSIMPSQAFEGFGLAVIESLACGTPVICTPVGGMPETLQPFSPQLITSTPDENAIAQTLEAALKGEMTIPTRNACRDYSTTNFNWYKISQQIRKVFLQ
jgi:glycosyltransferase involved in cell wall biosynthesis